MLVRQNAPVLGASASPYLPAGAWQAGLSYRGLSSDDHYVGTVEQHERHEIGNHVVNQQNVIDLAVTRGLTPRFNVSLSVPYIMSSWSIPLPTRPPGPRNEQNARGIGDTVLMMRGWVRNPSTCGSGPNVSVGLGVKAPTGRDDARDVYANLAGTNPTSKIVDMSIQPGDGGWGVVGELVAFARLGPTMAFGTATYLANPRNTNNQPSIIQGLGVAITPANARRAFNSVPDQFVVRAGVAFPTPIRSVGASLSARVERQPRYDLFGRSDGFRRPGTEAFVEPGLTVGRGRSVVSVSVPIAFYRNRHADPYTNARGDATFPNVIFLAGWSMRFGN